MSPEEDAEDRTRKRRRKGGAASGMLATPRLDRRARKGPPKLMQGTGGSPLSSAATDMAPPISKPAIPRGIGDDVPGPAEDNAMMKKGGRLTAAERHALPSKDFALPGERYPLPDKSHARNALARVSQFGSSTEKAKVRSAVRRKFPEIGSK